MYAQTAGVLLRESFLYSVKVLKGHQLPETSVHAAPVLPVAVALAPYRKKGLEVGTERMRFFCQSCGKGVECSAEEPPCEALAGWLTVSHWKGPGAVSRYNFCSFSCLKSWVDAQVPGVPDVFLKSFGEDERQKGKE